jgi:hypothetical protein
MRGQNMRRLAMTAFGLLMVCLWGVGCSSFATQTQKDFFTDKEDLMTNTESAKK